MTSLASTDTWYVRSDSSYGPDYVGLSPDVVAYIQAFAPSMASPGACTIQYPQMMVINSETVVGGQAETYGGQNTGFNMIVFTVTPNTFSVSRGNASQSLTYHF